MFVNSSTNTLRRERRLERKGYIRLNESAVIPNMRRNVRLRWDESEKPAPWAASVKDEPAEKSSVARISRRQSR